MSPYLIVGIGTGALGICLGAAGLHYTVDATELAKSQKALATEQAAHARDLSAVSAAAATAASTAIATQTKMQQDSDAKQAQIVSLQDANNDIDSKYRAALTSGTQRVRVRVASCTPDSPAGSGKLPGDTESASVSDDSGASAYLDRATSERVFRVGADDQQQIDAKAQLRAWACSIKPDAPGCK